jgi:hypothetical protein
VDPFLTMEVLYQLSYEGGEAKRSGSRRNACDARRAGDLRLSGGGRIRTCEG